MNEPKMYVKNIQGIMMKSVSERESVSTGNHGDSHGQSGDLQPSAQ